MYDCRCNTFITATAFTTFSALSSLSQHCHHSRNIVTVFFVVSLPPQLLSKVSQWQISLINKRAIEVGRLGLGDLQPIPHIEYTSLSPENYCCYRNHCHRHGSKLSVFSFRCHLGLVSPHNRTGFLCYFACQSIGLESRLRISLGVDAVLLAEHVNTGNQPQRRPKRWSLLISVGTPRP